MHTGALVPRRGTLAGVPGPRRSADVMRRRVVCPRSHPASLIISRAALSGIAAFLGANVPCLPCYSVLRNSAIATLIIPRPMTATMPSDSHSGTCHPPQLMAGANFASTAAGRLRCVNTACRIGPTT